MCLPHPLQTKVEWIGEPCDREGKKTFYSQVLISGNKVTADSQHTESGFDSGQNFVFLVPS